MENLFNWMTKPLPEEEVNIWLNVNNIILEKSELFYDFCISLISLLKETYLGDSNFNETKIQLSEEDNKKHFEWCWNKTIELFEREKIFFEKKGDHYDYFSSFFMEIFYNQKNEIVKNSVEKFFMELFDRDFPFTKSDLDLFTELYKMLDKSLIIEY
jgi:hypothetical protein